MSASMNRVLAAACLCVCLTAQAAPQDQAQDLGLIGPTYPIAEPDLLQHIRTKLQALVDSGEWARLQSQAQDRLKKAVREPTPVPLARTRMPRSFTFDPSTTLDRNLTDPKGRLIHAAGTRVNPLTVVSLSKRLVFFDGRDPQQVQLVERLVKEGSHTTPAVRWLAIATNGSPPELMKRWRHPVYFDQQGQLTRRLGIAQVPALVRQDGLHLRIEEVLP